MIKRKRYRYKYIPLFENEEFMNIQYISKKYNEFNKKYFKGELNTSKLIYEF